MVEFLNAVLPGFELFQVVALAQALIHDGILERGNVGERGQIRQNLCILLAPPLLSFLDAGGQSIDYLSKHQRGGDFGALGGNPVPWGFTRNVGFTEHPFHRLEVIVVTLVPLQNGIGNPPGVAEFACRAERRAACSFLEISRKNLRITVPPSFSWRSKARTPE